MSVDGKRYREHLYQLRSHPPTYTRAPMTAFADGRDSFFTVYLSIVPFVIAEYVTEANDLIPSGLVFPLGYLLFWAFYYTYYKPGILEERLTAPKKWDLFGLPMILMGVTIWFVKVTVVELTTIVFGRWSRAWRAHQSAATQGKIRSNPSAREQTGSYQSYRTQQSDRAHSGPKVPPRSHEAPPPKAEPAMPRDIVTALHILGLQEPPRHWNEIHRRYRELAKQYHPDLNHEITAVGRRFMMIDAAYRKLSTVKDRYFPERRDRA